MKCEDIMSTNLEWLSEQDTIEVAASKMAEAGVGFLPICDVERRVIGVVTDRDLVTRGIAKRAVLSTTEAALIMSSPALTCPQTTELGDAEDLMATNQKSRLIITDGEARLVGVLSLVDLLEHAPTARALQTTRAVLWREALGPRGGSTPGRPLLKDDPIARASLPPPDNIEVHPSAIKGGNHSTRNEGVPELEAALKPTRRPPLFLVVAALGLAPDFSFILIGGVQSYCSIVQAAVSESASRHPNVDEDHSKRLERQP